MLRARCAGEEHRAVIAQVEEDEGEVGGAVLGVHGGKSAAMLRPRKLHGFAKDGFAVKELRQGRAPASRAHPVKGGGLAAEFGAEVGMGDGDELAHAFAD